ncbi:hypothetical protein O1611_g4044 [Lasiodiplodia mahajangana]|uniref:Uncharacterized protein n=1 Tax=Lasiodiplodia mahajangana TaxID=1108764 RepID=A0ACC2JQ09_9PEZI|nr:hypothetical protein O1611_g4044 [Lasiodiplodia mahajangana]
MIDPLSILGGLSAGGQLLGAVVKTIAAISTLCENFQHAPRQLVRIKDRLIAIQGILTEVESKVQGLNNDDLLPENMRRSLHAAVATVLTDVEKVQKRILYPISASGSVRKRLQWATFRGKWTKKELEEIAQAEACLMDIMQVLISSSLSTESGPGGLSFYGSLPKRGYSSDETVPSRSAMGIAGQGHLNGRDTSAGEHSLSLRILKWLLEQGANPNDGDDDQVLPVFATLGMQPRQIRHFVQLPSSWDSSFECFRLLVSHGASVHEVALGKTLGTLNLVPRCPKPPQYDCILDYINLLRSENYADFDLSDESGWSLFVNAFRSQHHGLRAIQALAGSGANLSKILDDGRTYLAFAAEMSRDIRVLKYLYDNGCAMHLNRQDKWGWTPLHYCVFSERGSWHEPGTPVIKFLLDMGANPEIKAGEHERVPIPTFDSDHFTPIELANFLESYWPTGVTTLLRNYVRDEDVFYDAVESQGAVLADTL